MKLEVSYMSGAGNLFTVLNNCKYKLSLVQASTLAPILCSINELNSFKTEGLILIDSAFSECTDFSAHFFNPDGSNDAMCGNGGRCAVAFAKGLDSIPEFQFNAFNMAGEIYNFELNSDQISLHFPAPYQFIENVVVEINSNQITGTFVDVGSKHFVVDIAQFPELANCEFRQFDIMQIAPQIRYANEFAPNGVNVNIYKIVNEAIQLRTYERGVEFETGACGTGAISAALTIAKLNLLQFPIKVIPPSGIALIVNCKLTDHSIQSVTLTGPAEMLNTLVIDLPTNLL